MTKKFPKFKIIVSILIVSFFVLIQQGLCAEEFSSWLEELRQEARTNGISESTLHEALDNLDPIPRVIELDRRQPEFTQTFWRYLDSRVTEKRISVAGLF